jgi:hypothetical protein
MADAGHSTVESALKARRHALRTKLMRAQRLGEKLLADEGARERARARVNANSLAAADD